MTEQAEVVSNSLAFQLAQSADLLLVLGGLIIIVGAGGALILLTNQAKWRLVFLIDRHRLSPGKLHPSSIG
jgi:hypothetical protein